MSTFVIVASVTALFAIYEVARVVISSKKRRMEKRAQGLSTAIDLVNIGKELYFHTRDPKKIAETVVDISFLSTQAVTELGGKLTPQEVKTSFSEEEAFAEFNECITTMSLNFQTLVKSFHDITADPKLLGAYLRDDSKYPEIMKSLVSIQYHSNRVVTAYKSLERQS